MLVRKENIVDGSGDWHGFFVASLEYGRYPLAAYEFFF